METTGSKLIDATDVQLTQAAAGGDQRAFLILYDRYRKGLAAYVGKFVPVREEKEDVLLESFQKAFSQIAAYNPSYRFSTWLFSIARNTALDHLEKSGRENSNMPVNSIDEEGDALSRLPAATPDPEEDVIRSQEYDKLVAAIEGLSSLYREVARKVLLENYGYQEVAKELELPLGTVKIRVKRARENLLRTLVQDEEDGK